MDKEKAILLNAISQSKSDLRSALNIVVKPKSAEASEVARKHGNSLFLHQIKHDAVTHEEIFSWYCRSVALAPSESQELAFAYGNRSYFLLHIQKYEDCVKDIDKALKIACSDVLKAKLLCRKAECLKKLGFSDISNILEMVQNHVDKIDGQDKIKLLEMIDSVKALAVDTKEVKTGSQEKERANQAPLTEDYASRVSIKYNKKYGRHLVAARDYKPGDIIFQEKIYACCIPDKLNTYCQYCQKPVWSSVPCDYCSWAMFCSENCRERAWDDFHDIECSLYSHLKQACPRLWKILMVHTRILIRAMNKCGNIANLREKIESVDKCTDAASKGFFKNGQLVINSIENIYSLTSDTYHSGAVSVACTVPFILISLTKYSKIKDDFNVKLVEDLEINEDITFLGSLLIKIITVYSLNAFCSASQIVDTDDFGDQPSKNVNLMTRRILTTLSSLCNHSCFPTADWRYTEQNTFVLVALQPIKTDSQIFICYGNPFYEENQLARHTFLKKYNFTCDCQACVEAWPPIVSYMDQYQNEALGNNDLKENKKMVIENHKRFKEEKIDTMFVKKLSASITKASKFKQPSLTYCTLIDLLRKVLIVMYSPKSPSFDTCNK